MHFNTTPVLKDDRVLLTPLLQEHFELLYDVAKDPALWEYHPISNGFEKEAFEIFFKKAIETGSLLIVDRSTGKAIGCTRFYNYNHAKSTVVIGQTFYAKAYWGSGYNTKVKALMLNYAFNTVEKIIFYVIINNLRSQKAVEKLGATATGKMHWEVEGKTLTCIIYECTKK